MTTKKDEKPLSTDEKVNALIELLRANGMTIPKELEPEKD